MGKSISWTFKSKKYFFFKKEMDLQGNVSTHLQPKLSFLFLFYRILAPLARLYGALEQK